MYSGFQFSVTSCFHYFISLPFYINFRIIHTRKKFNGILNGIGLNLLLTGKNGHFNNIESSFFFFGLFRAALVAYGGCQCQGQIRATPAGLCHSLSNAISEPHLQPTTQLKAMPDP